MKNFLKIGFLATALFTSLGAIANEDSFVVKTNNEDEKSIVFLVNEAQNIKLSIVAQDDEIVYEQNIHTTKAEKKVYNLNAFPDGNYTLKLESALKLTSYQILIENGKAILSSPTIKTFFKPVIVREKGMLILDLKTPIEGAVDIVVLNEYNDELFKKEFLQAKSIHKFDVTNTNARELTFVVKHKDQEYIETIRLY
ncbi:DUF3244 domain-containing protein [Pedobacter insulae]|uniref:Por secretion system C-terminal sorting domain-containing protein n=1 Tax=Pedobacter insulae TaxID=414048 RepID=A0A1I2Y3H8_9SPHI|nr:hypothetical protein [Pedobacter insulae]SFH20274.1 hypothetical protein SAMN04489864_106206 [Pedobacter insulae]